MPLYHATITGKDFDAMADLVRKHKITVARHTVKKLARGYTIKAHATGVQLRALEKAGYKVKRREDVDKAGHLRQTEARRVSQQRFAGLTVAGGYLDVTEVESALTAVAASPNTTFTQLLTLPHKTWEDRVCHALKIGKGSGSARPGIYFLGGVHAREWGSPDILINLAQRLTQAYSANTGLQFGGKKFTAAQIQSIVNNKNVYIFPQANPDGRHHSMSVEAMWRKNRRPAPAGHTQSQCVGVDVNRNYDFMWNYPQYFDPASPIANSTDPCDHDVYIGPTAVSEPETKNAVWMFDNFPDIRYFIDIHSYSEAILYSWGDDDNQIGDPGMNFQNAAFNGKRGIANDMAYKEYMPSADRQIMVSLAKRMRNAIKAVRGRVYQVEQAVGLYPTAGTSDDYAFSRHIVQPGKPKVYAYTIEWGSPNNSTPFHPPYSEMQKIIQEITAALVEFCWRTGS